MEHVMRIAQSALVIAALATLPVVRHSSPLSAHGSDPTFADDVAPIFYRNCTVCHHDGGMAPFTLLDYDTAAAHADEIRDAVDNGVMPPWHATEPHGVFSNDRRLSDADRNTILRWIDAGAKPGDLGHLPPKPDYAAGWTFGTPDLVATMPEAFTIPASGTIDYQYFQVPIDLPEERWVQAIEVMPGAREVVHHVLVFAAPPLPATTAAPVLIKKKEYASKVIPRSDTVHGPPQRLGGLIGGYVPGTNAITFPKGTAMRLRPGTVLTIQMHYTAHGHEMHDRTSVGFKFADRAPDEEIFATDFRNGNFTIPAGARDVAVPSELGFAHAVRVWGLMPHTHLRGTRWQYTLVMPDSTSRIVLDVPHYDFNWQTYYLFAKPLEIPAGGKLLSMAWYDNSAGNKHNPDPTIDVHWGDQTWEEMQYTGILYSVAGEKP
jgi:mono/diheme cytochrome c family protein